MSTSANRIDELMLEWSMYLKKLELLLMIDFEEDKKHTGKELTAKLDNDTVPEFEYHGYQCPQMDELLGDSLHRNEKFYFNESQIGNSSDAMVTNMSMLEGSLEFVDLQEKINREKSNLVARIFHQFRSMHKYIIDEYPTLQSNYLPLDYVNNKPAKSALPRTLNIQYHIQVAHRKLLKFNARLRRILNANANFDNKKHKECNASLELLERWTDDLACYKDMEFRHRDFKFISEEMKARAENLELVIQRINEKIRETHHFIADFGWEMSQEDFNSMATKQQGQATIDYALQLVTADKQAVLQEQMPKYAEAKLDDMKLFSNYGHDVMAMPAALYDDKLTDDLLDRSESSYNNYFENSYPNAINLQFTNYMKFCASNGLLLEETASANVKLNQRTCKPMHNFG